MGKQNLFYGVVVFMKKEGWVLGHGISTMVRSTRYYKILKIPGFPLF